MNDREEVPGKQQDNDRELLIIKERYERLLNTVPCVLYDYVLWPDGRNDFIFISPKCNEIFEYDAGEIIGNADLLWGMVHAEDMKRLQAEDKRSNISGTRFQSQVRILTPSGKEKWIELNSMQSNQKYDGRNIWSGVILDISQRKKAEEENQQLLQQLQRALAEVKILSGFLPICASCKKIRDDKGYWNQIEAYLREHSEVQFSHGICPDCIRKLYSDIHLDI